MAPGTTGNQTDPDPEVIFSTFDDPACREILETIDEPMSASEISDSANIPVSTTYKKLDTLQEASLVTKETQLDPGGHHRAQFITDFDQVLIELDDDRQLSVDIDSQLAQSEQHIVEMWASVWDKI